MKSTLIKIFGTILTAFLSPSFALLLKHKQIWRAIKTGYYNEGYTGYPDYPIDSFIDILRHVYTDPIDVQILMILILLVLVLTPLRFYKEDRYEKGQPISFLRQWFILGIVFCLACLVFAPYLYTADIYTILGVLLLLPLSFALYVNILLYLFVDRWINKIQNHKK